MKTNSLLPQALMADPSIPNRIVQPGGFSPAQLLWAAQHDWFCFATPQAVYGWSQWSTGEYTIEKLTSFKALREWAGY
jgi:hypothetical protein